MTMARSSASWLLFLCLLVGTLTHEASASAQTPPWEAEVVALQSVAAVAHGGGHAAGMLGGAVVAFAICGSLFSKCPREKEALGYLVVTTAATVVGSAVGGVTTWGLGQAAGASGLLLPTVTFGAVGHVVGALTIVGLGASKNWRTQRAMWLVAPLVAGLLGGSGAIIGFHRGF